MNPLTLYSFFLQVRCSATNVRHPGMPWEKETRKTQKGTTLIPHYLEWYDLGQVTFLNLSLLICKMGTGQSGGDWDNIHTLGRLGGQHMVRCTQAQKMASIQDIQDPSHTKHRAGLLRVGK